LHQRREDIAGNFRAWNHGVNLEKMSDDETCRGRPGRKSKATAVASEYSDNDEEEQPKRKQSRKSKAESMKGSDATIVNDDFVEEEDLVRDERGETEHEAGQIMRVYVQDFMCHHKLTMDFGRHVNFVTGANGSGNDVILCCHFTRSFDNNLICICMNKANLPWSQPSSFALEPQRKTLEEGRI
jgi:hypothetical protein